MTIDRDAYAVLQVDPRAEDCVVSAAYRALARVCHPDGRAPDPARMAELNQAYERVKTPDVRRRYDQERPRLRAMGPGPSGITYDAWPDARYTGTTGPIDPTSALDFGRYSGWRICDIARTDPDYLRWLARHSTGVRYRDAIAQVLPGDRELGRRAHVLG